MKTSKKVETIAKLLRLAEDPAATEHERDTALRTAQRYLQELKVPSTPLEQNNKTQHTTNKSTQDIVHKRSMVYYNGENWVQLDDDGNDKKNKSNCYYQPFDKDNQTLLKNQ